MTRKSPREIESVLEDLEEKPPPEWSVDELLMLNLRASYDAVDDPLSDEEVRELWTQALERDVHQQQGDVLQ